MRMVCHYVPIRYCCRTHASSTGRGVPSRPQQAARSAGLADENHHWVGAAWSATGFVGSQARAQSFARGQRGQQARLAKAMIGQHSVTPFGTVGGVEA
jgi:hypothetical protein